MVSETHYIIDIIKHDKKHLPRVVGFLRLKGIKGNKVFTEASDNEIKSRHPFYGPLSKFLSMQQAIEIHEPEYEASMKQVRKIYEDTLPPVLRSLRSSKFGWQPDTMASESDRFNEIVCQVRNPIIARQIIEHAPIYSIFGPGHIPGVLAILREYLTLNLEVLQLFSPHRLSHPLTRKH